MRLDHIAYRVINRHEAARSLQTMFGYQIGIEFDIIFDNGSKAECIAMTPPEKHNPIGSILDIPWVVRSAGISAPVEHHLSPEIFISDGTPDSIVGEWVRSHEGGGIHHMAYMVDQIDDVVSQWQSLEVEFLSNDIIDCPEDDLRQIFTKPLPELGNVIIELIERGSKGFCQTSVKDLMKSTKGH